MQAYRVQLGLAKHGGLIPTGHEVFVEPGARTISEVWRQRGLIKRQVVVVDPKAKPTGELKDLKPSNHVTLIFTGKPCKDWTAWLKKHKVSLEEKGELTKTKMKGLLMAGAMGDFKLTEEAAEFISEVFGDSSAGGFFSICFTLENARDPDKKLLGMDEIADIWPDPGFKNARNIARHLGGPKALEIFLRIPRYADDSVFGLWRYLDIVCGNKHPQWLHLVHAYRSACDRKRFSYWEGLFLLIHHCYKEATWQSKSSKTGTNASSSLPRRCIPSKDLSQRCGTPF